MGAVMPWDWGSALTGGLAGSGLTIFTRWVSGLWLRPRLQIIFAEDPDNGCRIETNVDKTTNQLMRCYVRIKIKNCGRSTDHGVTACVTELTFEAPGASTRNIRAEVFDVKLSHRSDVIPFTLAPHAHRYLDVAHSQRADPPSFWYDLYPHLERLRREGFGISRGNFGAQVFVTADNAKATQRRITWEWDETFPGIVIQTGAGRLSHRRIASGVKRFFPL